MASASNEITFVIPGQAETAPGRGGDTRGQVKAAVRVGALRAGAEPVRVTARPGEDVVVMSITQGPVLVLHPEAARDLLLAQSATATRSGRAASGADVVVPAQLGWPGLEAEATRGVTRGWLGQALLGGFKVLTGLAKDPAAKLVAAAVTKKVDDQVEAGVYPSLPKPCCR
jgi:hypothetical protein